jgi:UDP-N-acetylglucosamine 2-epimerase (non-hydrolysing)
MVKKIKLVTGIGIRPDIIRLSEILKELDKYFDNITVDTGQHWDYNLNKVMYEQLEVREPNYRLEGKALSHTKQVGKIAGQFEDVLVAEKPDIVVILGDNNSSLAMALAASKLNIPIAHIESGNRSYNWSMPEEKNRTIIDHISDIHFCYTEDARANLIAEGIPRRVTWVVGNPIVDVMAENLHKRDVSVLDKFGVRPNEYVIVTCHRSENVTDPIILCNIIDQLDQIGFHHDIPVLLIEMPKLKENWQGEYPKLIVPIPPQPYLEFLQLERFGRDSNGGVLSEYFDARSFSPRSSRITRPSCLQDRCC